MSGQVPLEVAELHSASDSLRSSCSLRPAATLASSGRKHQLQGVDDVLPRLFACAALADRAGHFDDARDDPTILVGFVVGDRHLERLVHRRNDNAADSTRRIVELCEPRARIGAREVSVEERRSFALVAGHQVPRSGRM